MRKHHQHHSFHIFLYLRNMYIVDKNLMIYFWLMMLCFVSIFIIWFFQNILCYFECVMISIYICFLGFLLLKPTNIPCFRRVLNSHALFYFPFLFDTLVQEGAIVSGAWDLVTVLVSTNESFFVDTTNESGSWFVIL